MLRFTASRRMIMYMNTKSKQNICTYICISMQNMLINENYTKKYFSIYINASEMLINSEYTIKTFRNTPSQIGE